MVRFAKFFEIDKIIKNIIIKECSFIKSHPTQQGVVNSNYYKYADHMNIKSTQELKGYLQTNMYLYKGYQLSFRMVDKNIKPYVGYLNHGNDAKAHLTYDVKKNLYTVTLK